MTDDDRARARQRMSRERWAQLEPLIDAALALPPHQRDAYCDRIAADDVALGDEVRRLIGQATETGSLFEAAAAERRGLLFTDEHDRVTDTLFQQIQTALGTTYKLERELGGGGMSRVFIATEPSLGRQVVIKLLSPELSLGLNADRFAREIKLAASLQQANIVPLLAAGLAGGFPYYTMPVVDGRSLRDRLARDGKLPIADAVSILRDVARALAYAHGRGVVHRDVKPGNVLLSGGTAVVTDFGIAKALAASRGGGSSASKDADAEITLTEAGTSLGTPAYMAPEQAMGDPSTDHRADLYAFGCMAYEMFTGNPPFHGGPMHKIVAAHLRERPRPIAEHRADVPASITDLIARCLEKDPADRPQQAADILTVLDGANSGPIPQPRPSRRRTAIMAGALAGAALAGAAAIAVIQSVESRAPLEPLTMAAIPFRNMARDTALDYRSDGIRDEILTSLARVPGVQIIGRTAAYRYKDRLDGSDLRAIARDLGVRFVVTGTLRENNGQVTISAQLNDSTTRAELWADTFVRDSKDFGSIADDIVRTITDTLRGRFGKRVGMQQARRSTAGTTSSEALDLYLLGQEQLKRRGAGVRQSVMNFERAVTLDPKFARAYAALATALQLYPYFVGVHPDEVKDTTIATANRALALDSTLADPHVALGTVYAHQGRWDRAMAEFRRAVELDPNDVGARVTFGRYLVTIGHADEALAQLKAGQRVERISPLVSAWLGYSYYMLGQPDSAVAESEKAVQLDSALLPAANFAMLLRLARGKYDEARRIALVPPTSIMTYAPYVYAKTGDTATANRLLTAMQSRTPRPWFADVAEATMHLAVGDSAAALTALERTARAAGPVWVEYILLGDPAYDLVRRSPRFIAVVQQANLDIRRFDRPSVAR